MTVFVACNDGSVAGVSTYPFNNVEAMALVPEWAITKAMGQIVPSGQTRLAVYKIFEDGSDLLTVIHVDGGKISDAWRWMNEGTVSCVAYLGTTMLKRWLKIADFPISSHGAILKAVK